MTNYERIKNMSVEEMVLFLHSINHFGYGYMHIDGTILVNENLLDWLNREVKKCPEQKK